MDSEYCLLSVGALLWPQGYMVSEQDFKQLIECEVAIPLGDVEYYADCFEVVEEPSPDFFLPTFPGGKVEESGRVFRLLMDVVTITDLSFFGQSQHLHSSCALDWEMDQIGREVLDPDGYGAEIPGGDLKRLARVARDRMGDEVAGCHFLELWYWEGGKSPDTPMGPGEYDSYWEPVGEVTVAHLQALVDMVGKKEKV